MREYGLLNGLQFRAGVNAEIAIEDGAGTEVDVEGLGLSSGAIQGDHQPGLKRLAKRHLVDDPAQVGDDIDVSPGRQLGVDPTFERERPELVEPGPLAAHRIGGGEIGQRGPAPEPECPCETGRRRRSIAVRHRP